MDINDIAIFGERNCGTKYLRNIIKNQLKIRLNNKYGFKHFYIKGLSPRGIENTTTDNECVKSIYESENTLFLFIIRNPYDWVSSMFRKPYHIKNNNAKNLLEFVSQKYIAYENTCIDNHWTANEKHKYPYFIEEADNLIDLRNKKNNHFIQLGNKVKNFQIIRQEHLLDDINFMIKKFNLGKDIKSLDNFKKPISNKLDDTVNKFINSNLDNPIDNKYYLS